MTVIKGKFGYYGCDKETYLMVKHIRKCYFRALRKAYDWNRVHVKQPQNRNRKISLSRTDIQFLEIVENGSYDMKLPKYGFGMDCYGRRDRVIYGDLNGKTDGIVYTLLRTYNNKSRILINSRGIEKLWQSVRPVQDPSKVPEVNTQLIFDLYSKLLPTRDVIGVG